MKQSTHSFTWLQSYFKYSVALPQILKSDFLVPVLWTESILCLFISPCCPCFRPCVYQWRSSDRGRRKRPAELLPLLRPRQACPHPAQMVTAEFTDRYFHLWDKNYYSTLEFNQVFFLNAESEEALLKMSVSQPESGAAVLPDFSSMTEEEQIAYAMQMSLAGGGNFHLWSVYLF